MFVSPTVSLARSLGAAVVAGLCFLMQAHAALAFGACPCCTSIHDPGHTSVSSSNGQILSTMQIQLEQVRSDLSTLQQAIGVEGGLFSVFESSMPALLGTVATSVTEKILGPLGRARVTDRIPIRLHGAEGVLPRTTVLDPDQLLDRARNDFFSAVPDIETPKVTIDRIRTTRREELQRAAVDGWVTAGTLGETAKAAGDRTVQSLSDSGTQGTNERAQLAMLIRAVEAQTAAIDDTNKLLAALLRLQTSAAMSGMTMGDPDLTAGTTGGAGG